LHIFIIYPDEFYISLFTAFSTKGAAAPAKQAAAAPAATGKTTEVK
jgi:hypothetical protein